MDPNNTPNSDTGSDNKTVSGPQPKFFILHATGDLALAQVNPWAVNAGLQGMVGTVKSIKPLRSGDLLVEVGNDHQSLLLQKTTSIADQTISVTPHQTLNSSKGVITSNDLKHHSDETLRAGLAGQGVSDLRRIMLRRDGNLIPSRVVILTFNTPIIPERVLVGYISCPVREYVPNPLRCFNCQRFGHGKSNCRGTLTCARCAETGHESDSCSAEEKCVNCSGKHPAFSKSCPKWKDEKEVQSVKTSQKLTYPEARRLVASRTPGSQSYAAAVSREMKSVEVQTEVSISPHDDVSLPAEHFHLPLVQRSTTRKSASSQSRPVNNHPSTSQNTNKKRRQPNPVPTAVKSRLPPPPVTSSSKLSKPVVIPEQSPSGNRTSLFSDDDSEMETELSTPAVRPNTCCGDGSAPPGRLKLNRNTPKPKT